MIESLTYALTLLVLIAGLFFLFYMLVNRLLFKTGNDEFFTVVIGKGGDCDLPDKVYSAFLQANTLNFSYRKPVYVIDCGINEDMKRKCFQAIYPDKNLHFFHGEFLGSNDEYIVIHLDKE